MKLKSTVLMLLAALSAGAVETSVDPATLQKAFASAADGDVLLLAEGAYGGQFTFPAGKTVTLKAAPEADVTFGGLFRANDATLTDGGIVLDGLNIRITDSYFISLDNYGDIREITVRNCEVANVGRCFLRTNNAGFKIDGITFDNCKIHDCGTGGWNFLYPKHAVGSVTVTNSTLYNYQTGESFFCPNANAADNTLTFTFTHNTVYRWGKSNDRALCKSEGRYSKSSVYTFTDNIVYKGGANGVLPQMIQAKGGTLTAKNNLVVEYGGYNMSDGAVSDISDLSLEGLGLTGLSFPDPANGDFTIVSSSPLATASTTGGVVGDPRWLKTIASAAELTVTASPAAGGSVTPESAVFESGESVTVTAQAAYGYRFGEWRDASGKTLSTENPYTFTIGGETALTAIFNPVDTYTLTVDKTGEGAAWGKVSLSPEPVNGIYETGTEVAVRIVPNSVTSFLAWENGSADPVRSVVMDGDKTVRAEFDVIPFIVAWDFASGEPRGNRPADYAMTTDNTGLLTLVNADGSTTNWGASTRNFGGNELNCIRRYTDRASMSAPRAFVASFNAAGYTNVRIQSLAAADNDCVHSVQKMQYSTDGVNYTDLASIEMTKNEWIPFNATLPEGLGTVYVRWVGDKESALIGTPGDKDTEGFYLADIAVFADLEAVNDTEAPRLLGSSPAAGSNTASAKGNFILTFNERVQAGKGGITLNGVELTGKYGSKTASFAYSGLDYGTQYVFSVAPGAITDMAGNPFEGTEIRFTTMQRPEPAKRGFDAIVAQDGTGTHATVQAAIDGAPEGRVTPYLIFVKNGEYEELVRIPKTKPFIHLIGQDKEKTIIKFWINNGGSSDIGYEYSTNNPASKTYGYQGVFQVDATDFYTENITYYNSYGVEKQAGPMGLAMRSCNDRQAFNNCSFRSFQDTWFTTTTNVSDRHYVNNCFIEGAVDYFYGAGDIYVENTTFHNARSTGSVVVAPAHHEGTKWGYVMESCVLEGAGKDHKLGRAWNNAPITVWLNTTFKTTFAPEGWSEWHIAPKLFAEYNSTDADGNPIDLTHRRTEYKVDGQDEKVRRQAILTAEEAARYTYENVTSGTDGWNPRSLFEAVEAPAEVQLDPKTGVLTWNESKYAICYVVTDSNDNVIAITTETTLATGPASRSGNEVYSVTPVNEFGSLGTKAVSTTGTSLLSPVTVGEVTGRVYYNAAGMASDTPFDGFNIIVETLSDGTSRTSKAILK